MSQKPSDSASLVDYEQLHRRFERQVVELRRKNEELEQFAYAASHDLQEPLRMVAQYAQVMERDLREKHPEVLQDESFQIYLKHMVNGADRSKRLIDGLLAYSRVGRQATFEAVQLDDCINEAIQILNGAVSEAGATILRSPMPVAYGDRMMLARVFLNLITNAIRFTREGEPPTIDVSCEDGGEEWILSVGDNGVGIDPRHAERIFVIFQRLDPSKNGTGIGLAISKKIIERHGGRIWVESLGRGHGSVFRFTIAKRSECPSAQ